MRSDFWGAFLQKKNVPKTIQLLKDKQSDVGGDELISMLSRVTL